MSYLIPNFDSPDAFMQNEILRLQDLCAENFGKIDELKKENKRLTEIHTELRETTSDLAYSLAECPWWQKESLQSAVKILATFAQKMQYILELPTFIDPVEQLNRNGGFGRCEIAKILKRRSSKTVITSPCARTCGKCKKRFNKISNYEIHKRIHPLKSKKLKCKVCTETFSSFMEMKIHLKNFHSFLSEDAYANLRDILNKNHVKVWRFYKCKYCDMACASTASLKRHLSTCRSLATEIPPASPVESTAEKSPATNVESTALPLLTHEDTSDEEKHKVDRSGNSSTPVMVTSTTGKPDEFDAVPGATLTIAQAPVRLATMHSFSISSPTYNRSGDGEGVSSGVMDPSVYFLSSSSSSGDSDVETSVIQEPYSGEITRKLICSFPQCLKSFSTRGKLAHHRKSHTKTTGLLSCQICGKEFHDKYRMKSHLLSHCPEGLIPKQRYRCLECGAPHQNLNELADHSEKAHPVSKLQKPLFSCSSCGFATNLRRKFDVHLKRKCKGRPPVDINSHSPEENKQSYYPTVPPKSVETCTSSTSNSLNN